MAHEELRLQVAHTHAITERRVPELIPGSWQWGGSIAEWLACWLLGHTAMQGTRCDLLLPIFRVSDCWSQL